VSSDSEFRLREHLANLRGVQVLGRLMVATEDEARIAQLACSAVTSLVPTFHAHGISLEGPPRWFEGDLGEGSHRPPGDLDGLTAGGRVHRDDEAWTWAFVLGPVARRIGCLLVGGDREPTANEVFLLQTLAHEVGDAVIYARAHSRERAAALDALRASEERFRQLAELAPDVIYRVSATPFRFDYVSPSVFSIDGATPEEHYTDPGLIGRIFTPEAWAHLLATAEDGTGRPVRLRWPRADGGEVWTEHVVKPLPDEHGAPQGLLGIARDVSRQMEVEAQLHARVAQQAAVSRLAHLALSGVEETVLLSELTTALAEILAVPLAAVYEFEPQNQCLRRRAAHGHGPPDGDRVAIGPPAPLISVPPFLGSAMEGTGNGTGAAPFDIDGRRVLAYHSVLVRGDTLPWGRVDAYATTQRSFAPDEIAFAQSLADVASMALQRRRTETEIIRRSLHDPLTNLPNRSLLMDRIEQALHRAERRPSQTAVLLLDLDHFKVINDSLGHAAGDALLISVARRLDSCVRPADTVARISGDEFVILCEDIDADGALAVADRISHALVQPFTISGRQMHVSISTGVALADDTGAEALLANADAAMYLAKRRGRSRHELFDQSLRDELTTRLETEEALRRALANHEFRVHFQPIVALDSEAITGVEALVRWQHPTAGLLLPGHFIPLSEQSNLVVDIGTVVLDDAARQAGSLRRSGVLSEGGVISVNLSARQLDREDLPTLVHDASAVIRRTGCQLCLEITESAVMSDPEGVVARLHQLRAAGASLAIDDFGAGYTSLGYLKRFPVNVLKIDRSFIEGLGRRGDDQAIVTAIVELGHGLGLTVLAEGVERAEQRDQLRVLGCDLAQGFLWARPAPVDQLTASTGTPAPTPPPDRI
jgi:diguanylate cyclase (GGDEF)-like protein/PAS domain S-box-containing protein